MVSAYIQERILELPLFQGMSRNDLAEVFASVKLSRTTCAKGRIIAAEGDLCDRLHFIVEGKISVSCNADDHGYTLTEEFQAPELVQPERIFGLTQRFTRTVTAATNCELMSIGKHDVVLLSDKYEIFRLNLLNIICTGAQRMNRIQWRQKPVGVRNKILRFVESRCLRPAGSKTVTIKMERLAAEIGESRLNVSNELNAMNDCGMIELHRAEFVIPALEKVTQ